MKKTTKTENDMLRAVAVFRAAVEGLQLVKLLAPEADARAVLAELIDSEQGNCKCSGKQDSTCGCNDRSELTSRAMHMMAELYTLLCNVRDQYGELANECQDEIASVAADECRDAVEEVRAKCAEIFRDWTRAGNQPKTAPVKCEPAAATDITIDLTLTPNDQYRFMKDLNNLVAQYRNGTR